MKKYVIETATIDWWSFKDKYFVENVIALLDKLESEDVLIHSEQENSRNFQSPFEPCEYGVARKDSVWDDIQYDVEIYKWDINVYSNDNTSDVLNYDKTCEDIKDWLFHYSVSTSWNMQSERDEYHFVFTRELTDEEEKTLDELQYCMSYSDVVISLVEKSTCETCNHCSNDVVDSIWDVLPKWYVMDEMEFVKWIVKDHFQVGLDEIDFENSKLDFEYRG